MRPIFSPRGIIYDRSKKVLVENRPSFGLMLETEEFRGGRANLEDLSASLKESLGYEPEALSGYLKQIDSPVLPREFVAAQNLTPEEVVSIAPRLASIPGVQLFESFRRFYNDNYAYSHVLGFVGTVSEEDLAGSPELKSGDTIGKSGIEAYYDEILRGSPGKKIAEIDANGNETCKKEMHLSSSASGCLSRFTILVHGWPHATSVHRHRRFFCAWRHERFSLAISPISSGVGAR